jgi:hypothetical protein
MFSKNHQQNMYDNYPLTLLVLEVGKGQCQTSTNNFGFGHQKPNCNQKD